MQIKISSLEGNIKNIATKIDYVGNNNNEIDIYNEELLFKAKCSSMVKQGILSKDKYESIFGNGSFLEWSTSEDYSNGFKNEERYKYYDKNGNTVLHVKHPGIADMLSTGLSLKSINSPYLLTVDNSYCEWGEGTTMVTLGNRIVHFDEEGKPISNNQNSWWKF